MTEPARYLITTADERSWKFDRPVIFLGEWCRLYERRHVWSKMDAIVAAPYGLGQLQKDKDYVEARDLEKRLFPLLCAILNQHHGTEHGPRFWRIVVGHWLRRYVDVILNRVRTLEQCLRTYPLSGTTAFADEHYVLASLDSYAAIWAFSDDQWNNVLCVRILKLIGATNVPVEVIDEDSCEGYRLQATPKKPAELSFATGIRHLVKNAVNLLARESDAFIINSYIPKKEVIKLQLDLGQVPQFWTSMASKVVKNPDFELRQSLSGQIVPETGEILFSVMGAMLFQLLPVTYLEGFADLQETVRRLPWPRKPRLVFTSNNFDTDEVFKLWVAEK
ncbi:MAG: hypothetical protein IPO13_08655 [Rhodocyclaceae bacterium]|nr:hypothetical protein [Rhodocyclaceae bacterium]